MTLLAIDKVSLENVAQWLEARGDPMQSASEIRNMIANAKPSEDPELALLQHRVIRNYGGHSCGLHKPRSCAVCNVIERYEKTHPVKA